MYNLSMLIYYHTFAGSNHCHGKEEYLGKARKESEEGRIFGLGWKYIPKKGRGQIIPAT